MTSFYSYESGILISDHSKTGTGKVRVWNVSGFQMSDIHIPTVLAEKISAYQQWWPISKCYENC
jgi:hypothetical protein